MTEVKAITQLRTDSYDNFYNANLAYKRGEHTFIESGSHAGHWKVGDGVTRWRSLPFSPRTASLNAPGLVAGSNAQFFGVINPDGTFTLNGIAEAVTRIDSKDASQDSTLSTHAESIANLETTVAGMSGTIIYIGTIEKFTDELNDMTASARNALLTARAIELRGHTQDGYTLEDKGAEDEPGRFNYWQYQSDGTWFDLGERGEVSIATNTDYGIVKGSVLYLKINLNPYRKSAKSL
jgi:streptogramin lyase